MRRSKKRMRLFFISIRTTLVVHNPSRSEHNQANHPISVPDFSFRSERQLLSRGLSQRYRFAELAQVYAVIYISLSKTNE